MKIMFTKSPVRIWMIRFWWRLRRTMRIGAAVQTAEGITRLHCLSRTADSILRDMNICMRGALRMELEMPCFYLTGMRTEKFMWAIGMLRILKITDMLRMAYVGCRKRIPGTCQKMTQVSQTCLRRRRQAQKRRRMKNFLRENALQRLQITVIPIFLTSEGR